MKKLILSTSIIILIIICFTSFAISSPMIKFLSGKVQFKRGGEWKAAWGSMTLKLSDEIRVVGDNSYLTISYKGKLISIKPNSSDNIKNIIRGKSSSVNYKGSGRVGFLFSRTQSSAVTGIRDTSLVKAFNMYQEDKIDEAYNLAEQFVNKTPSGDPNLVKAYYLMSRILYENGQFKPTITHLSKIQEIGVGYLNNEESKNYCIMQGDSYYMAGDHGNAVAWMTQYIEAYEDESTTTLFAYNRLASAYVEMGMKKEAKEILVKMKEIDNSHKFTRKIKKKVK